MFLVDRYPVSVHIAFLRSIYPHIPFVELRGLLELLPGDAIVGRPIDKAGDPAFDCVQLFVSIG